MYLKALVFLSAVISVQRGPSKGKACSSSNMFLPKIDPYIYLLHIYEDDLYIRVL
jgi:hypothetical protein